MEHVFCCGNMEFYTLSRHLNDDESFASSEKLIYYSEVFDEYGLIIRDGGKSFIEIIFCPWCGKKLPDSQRDNWFLELEKLGFDNPFEDDIPEIYRSGAWRN